MEIKLTSPSVVIKLLRENGIELNKAFGQHFLVDENIRRKIIEAANISKSDVVLEIGPGIGTLSQEIAPKAKKLWLIELEKRFIPILEKTLAGKNIEIIQGDALKIDISKLKPRPNKVISNLPYNIASPLIMKFLRQNPFISEQIVMVQQEIADRLTAKVNTKDYNALSVKVSYLARIRKLFSLSEQVFLPKPKVRSAVIYIKRYTNKAVDEHLFKVVEGVFRYRRKTIRKGLVTVGIEPKKVQDALENAGIESNKRPQNLTLEDYRLLSDELGPY